MGGIKLYGSLMSNNSLRVSATLYEKGLSYDFVDVNLAAGEHKQPAFLAINVI